MQGRIPKRYNEQNAESIFLYDCTTKSVKIVASLLSCERASAGRVQEPEGYCSAMLHSKAIGGQTKFCYKQNKRESYVTAKTKFAKCRHNILLINKIHFEKKK